VGGLTPLRGDGLLAAFYMNELLVRLLARGDPHEALFGAYAHALHALASDGDSMDAALRGFELDLLREIGWLPPLGSTSDGLPIAAELWYRIDPERGPVATQNHLADDPLAVRGVALNALIARDWSDAGVATECRRLLRTLIAVHLGSRPLNTRRILQDLKKL
jgi:DNA repair protein RecO (recombination protein O)